MKFGDFQLLTLEPFVLGYDFVDPIGVGFSYLFNHLKQNCHFLKGFFMLILLFGEVKFFPRT